MIHNHPLVYVILVNWNGKADTLDCLDSLWRVDYARMKVLVVDNGSSDGSAQEIPVANPHVELLALGRNLGFVGGNNAGITYSLDQGAEYVLLLNNDTTVSPDFLTRLVAAAESGSEVGVVGPVIYYHSQPEVIWSAGGRVDWQSGSTHMVGIGEREAGQFGSAPRKVDFISGCAMLIKAEALKQAGLLDASFFMYYEEVEWCVRFQRAGYTILHTPAAKIWHKISPEAREASPVVHYYMTRNRLIFLKKTQANWKAWVHTLVSEYLRTLVSWSVRPRWRGKRAQRNAMLAAIRDYFLGKSGAWEH